MTDESTADRDQRVNQILAAFLEAERTGKAPDRAELLRRHPDLAAELQSFFADLGQFQKIAEPIAPRPKPAEAVTVPPSDEAGDRPQQPTLAPDTDIMDAAARAFVPGDRVRYFGDYELLEEIARGGMGVVYKARQVSINRLVALKMILSGQFASKADVQRFRTEAEAAGNLDHPNIVPIYEVNEHQGQQYFSMKLIEGGSLAQAVGSRQWAVGSKESQRQAAQLVATVARAVHHAHQRGILHRDLKPGNILLAANPRPSSLPTADCPLPTPLVTDFGLAKRVESDAGLTQSGAIVGTPAYMAPEQAAGKKGLTTAVDVYSLGAILFELLTGRSPFVGATPMDVVLQVLEADPPRPRTIQPKVDRDLETICLKCLAKEPARRYGSAEALADDLERWLAGEPIAARRASLWERGVKWAKRRPAAAALCVVSALALIALFTGGTLYHAELQEALRDAKDQRARVQDREIVLRRHLYGYDIKAAQEARGKEDTARVLNLLRAHIPNSDQEDIRSFDWHHFWKLCHGDLFTLPTPASETVAYTPDGEYLVTAGFGDSNARCMIELRDPKAGGVFRTLRDVPGAKISIAHDSKTIAVAGERTIAVIDVATGERRQVLNIGKPSEGWLRQVAFSPTDNKSLAVNWGNNQIGPGKAFVEVKLFDLADGTARTIVRLPTIYGAVMAFSPDGKKLAVAAEREMTVWDLATNQPGLKIPRDMRALAYSPDGKLLAISRFGWGDSAIVLLDAANGKELAVLRLTMHSMDDAPMAFSPDGKMLAAAVESTIRLWDVATRKELGVRVGHTSRITSLTFSPDGKRLASAALRPQNNYKEHGEVKVWDVAESPVPEKVTLDYREPLGKGSYAGGTFSIRGLGFAPGSNRLIASATRPGSTARMPPQGLENELVFDRREYASRGAPLLLKSVTAAPATHALCWQSVNLRQVAYSPDSKLVAVAQSRHDKAVVIWDTASGQTRKTLTKDHPLYAVAFSPDGRTLAGVSLDRAITLWDVATWTERAVLRGHAGWIDALSFAPNSQLLVTAGYDGIVKAWDVATGKEQAALPRHVKRLEFMRLAPDSQTLLIGGLREDDEREMRLWDIATGKEKASLVNYQVGSSAAVFMPDQKSLALVRHSKGARPEICFADLASGAATAVFRGDSASINHIVFAPNGKTFAAASSDKTVTVWAIADQKPIAKFVSPETIQSLAYAPDGKTLATWNWDSALRLWDTATYAERAVLRADNIQEFWSVAFSPDSGTLATLRINASEVKLWHVTTGELRGTIKADGGSGMHPVFAPDGKTIVTDNWSAVRLWDVATAQERAVSKAGVAPSPTAMSADGSVVLSVRSESDKLHSAALWDVSAGRVRAPLAATSHILRGAFSADGRLLVTAHAHGSVTLWDATTGKKRSAVTDYRDNHSVRFAFAPDGTALATANLDKIVKVWDTASGAELAALSQVDVPRNLAFDPKGRLLAIVEDNGTIRLWDWKEQQEKVLLQRERRGASSDNAYVVAFSADGRTLATCDNRAIKLWDTTTGLKRLTLWQGPQEFFHLAFSDDGRTLAASTYDAIFLWHAATEQEVARSK